MKQEKFEKVVEWEKEPDWNGMAVSLFFIFILGIISFVFYGFIHLIISLLGIVVGIMLFLECLGKGRKVYWRKIK